MNNFNEALDKKIDNIISNPLSKKKQNITVTIFSKPKLEHIKLTKEDINKIKNKALGNQLIKFRKKLYKKFKSENLNLLNNNIKSLKVKIKYVAPEILLLKFASGKYKIRKNKIELIKYFKDGTTHHELLHMASTFYDKKAKLGFCGFQQINYLKEETIGRGLNEGYTEILTNRFFKKETKNIDYSYEICKFFVLKLEEIVEKDRMEKFYITADLAGLCKYLTNFDDFKNIILFLLNLDYLINHASLSKKKFKRYYELIECYLAKWYIDKKKQELDKNIIDKETFDIKIKNYIDSLENKDLYIENFIKQKEYYFK